MQQFFLVAAGTAIIPLGWLAYLVVKHGWGWVLARLEARKATLEADAKAKAAAILGPIESRVAALEAKVAALGAH